MSGRCEIYLDGGICRGTDVFKALALGAKAVFIGRPVLWGLAHSVSLAVKLVLGYSYVDAGGSSVRQRKKSHC